ncbi:MAG: hypothetical protein ACXWJX_06430, partial [Limisphaerales bacterium]
MSGFPRQLGGLRGPSGELYEPFGGLHEWAGELYEPFGRLHEPLGGLHELLAELHGSLRQPPGWFGQVDGASAHLALGRAVPAA